MIQSHLIHDAAEGAAFLIYDTVSDGKHVFTACGLGRAKKKDMLLTDTARATLMALGDYVQQTLGAVQAIRLQEIATLPAVQVRMRKALAAADQEDILFFVCRSQEIYDATVAALNVTWTRHGTPQ